MASSPSSVLMLGMAPLTGGTFITLGFGTGATPPPTPPAPTPTPPATTGAGTWQRLGNTGNVRDARGANSEPSGRPLRRLPEDVTDAQEAKAAAQALAQTIIEHRREISRIKTQMRLSSNVEALAVMDTEIAKLETIIAQSKRDADDMLLLAILM